jgi:Cys-tRNA(Pro) deacylase
MDYPVTAAVRMLRAAKIEFAPHLYDYVEKGGTRVSAEALAVDEHAVVKTLVFETEDGKPLIVLMHGDRQVSAKELARQLALRSVHPADSAKAQKVTGYLVGGTSPFGTKTRVPVYVEGTIFELEKIYINGGKRGFLVSIAPAVLRQLLEVKDVNVAIEN